jgi:pimeloyl-ACP methyl ester carboxylesterase/membrane protein DedA with SNARE-associated domain
MPQQLPSGWRVLAVAWVLLVLVSNAYRIAAPRDNHPAPEQLALALTAPGAETPGAPPVKLAYRIIGPAQAPAVVLLHGSPVASMVFDRLLPHLPDGYRYIVPDMPGFGGSSLRIPDYSIAAHARYLEALLAQLQADAAHVVAYSMGGGIALELYRQHPSRLRSLTLLSSIGVQELELLGNYQLNHAVHLAQLGLLQGLTWLTPHFGLLDTFPINVAYARNFADSDQRPLRNVLAGLEAPTLILHGKDDGLVPLAAAAEHHRLVPQSRLATFDGGHMLLVSEPAVIAAEITAFLASVERGTAATREDAPRDLTATAMEPFDWDDAPRAEGIALAVLLLLLFAATWVVEDLTCIATGLLVARGTVGFLPGTLACLAGIFTSDLMLFLAGRHLGRPALHRPPLRWLVSAQSIERSELWFARRGALAILLSRFLPAFRVPTYVTAGLLGMRLSRFVWVFLVAAILWTPLLVGTAWLVGEPVIGWLASWSRYGLTGVLILALVLFLGIKYLAPLFTLRGRRLAYSRWQRVLRWEFWPPWLFYPPVVLYILYLGLRFRGLTVFTAANPGIPAGGVVGESKFDILRELGPAGTAYLPHTERLPGGDTPARAAAVARFQERHGLSWPLVLKPDVGERGRDVAIVRSRAQVQDYLAAHAGPTLVQEYAPGHEFGVFYYRHPDNVTGRIFAVTDKRPPRVVGDGRSTLEELILRDERAVLMAEHFLDTHAAHLYDVPARGAVVPLVELGTHCLGCEFVDGGWVVTPALTTTIDRISKQFPGFCFGRYDIRTPSVEDFRKGRNFRVVELNGVTSEATSIYDPANSIFAAWRVLMRQWHIAFEIGAANRERGVQPVSIGELWRLVRAAA